MIGEMAAGAGDTEAQPRSSLCSVRRHNNTIDQTGPLSLVGIAEILLSLVQSFRVLKYFNGVADAMPALYARQIQSPLLGLGGLAPRWFFMA